jgi:hypothetical protein
MLSKEKGLPLMLSLVSYYDISSADIAAIASEARYQVTIHAKEKKELSVSCIK